MSSGPTPMMAQYRRVRNELAADVILFFRLGDFYEMFFDDAITASRILDITLTRRQKVPMCGVPYHAAENYIARLVRAGRKVAVCDQVEDASAAKGIVKREVTRIVTPGTVLEEGALEAARSNYLAGVCRSGAGFGLAMLDLSTGEFRVEEAQDPAALSEWMAACAPAEMVAPEEQLKDGRLAPVFAARPGARVTRLEDWLFERDVARDRLLRHFGVVSLDGFGGADLEAGLGAAGAVLHYVADTLRRSVDHVRAMRVCRSDAFLFLDEATVVNLELLSSR